jgi:hypothetical protein
LRTARADAERVKTLEAAKADARAALGAGDLVKARSAVERARKLAQAEKEQRDVSALSDEVETLGIDEKRRAEEHAASQRIAQKEYYSAIERLSKARELARTVEDRKRLEDAIADARAEHHAFLAERARTNGNIEEERDELTKSLALKPHPARRERLVQLGSAPAADPSEPLLRELVLEAARLREARDFAEARRRCETLRKRLQSIADRGLAARLEQEVASELDRIAVEALPEMPQKGAGEAVSKALAALAKGEPARALEELRGTPDAEQGGVHDLATELRSQFVWVPFPAVGGGGAGGPPPRLRR